MNTPGSRSVSPRRPLVAAVAAVLVIACGASGGAPSAAATTTRGGDDAVLAVAGSSPVAAASAPSLAQLVGQKLVVAMAGTSASPGLLARIRAGEVGGVILFGSNVSSAGQLAGLTRSLRAAAAAGGQPPLLVVTDQEGGSIRRLPWAAPTLSPPSMGATASASTAEAQGRATATDLRCAGTDSPLAPVADVPVSTSSFLYQQGRTFSFDASVTASLADAFATGLEARGGVPAMKHFPGLGLATANTDTHVVTINASKTTLAPGLLPYEDAIGHGLPLVMLSNATYPAYDATNAAGWSHAIGTGLLRDTLGFNGVTMTDSLNGTAKARGVSATSLAVKSAQAGTDMLLLTGSEAASAATFQTLFADATSGAIARSTLETSYARIVALKSTLAGPVADSTAPAVTAPGSHLLGGVRLGSTTVPVATSWSAADGCGISREGLERRSGSGAWVGQSLAGATSTSVVQSLTRGTAYRYATRATDGAGNTSGWAYGPTFVPHLAQETSTRIDWVGAWHRVGNTLASGGAIEYSTARGATATYSFTGSAIAWVAFRGPTRGSAAVYVDGTYRTSIDLHAASSTSQPIVYAIHWATSGPHAIRIVNLGTTGHSRVDVDGFVRLSPT